MHDTFRMLFVALMAGALLPDVMSVLESSTAAKVEPLAVVATAHTASDGIKDRKLALIAKNQASMMRRQISKRRKLHESWTWQQQCRS
jgi:hypothetical protein